jgi:predicted nucleotide-binding protein (sugar kinase/HSP70/actin superfamily)
MEPAELLAGLTATLPRTIWESVVAAPSLSALGEVFVLSGGVQRNAAAVRAQAEYVLARHPRARVVLHPFPGEAGAIGAALAGRAKVGSGRSTFIGLAAAIALRCSAQSDETTRCRRCPSQCARTRLVAERSGDRRELLAGNGCERGALPHDPPVIPSGAVVVHPEQSRGMEFRSGGERPSTPLGLNGGSLPIPANPLGVNGTRAKNLLRTEASRIFRRAHAVKIVSTLGRDLRIAIPRVLSLYRAAPLLTHYFEALGVPASQLVTGTFTSEALWRRSAGRGTTDACFPAKVAQAHIAELLARRDVAPFDVLFFPVLTHAVTGVKGCLDTAACPVVAGTPLVTRMAFGAAADGTLPGGVRMLTPTIVLSRRKELSAGLYESIRTLLPTLPRAVHELALAEGLAGQRRSEHLLEQLGAAAIRDGASAGRCAIVLLGRPYHADPGLHHELGSELVSLGRTAMSLRALPHSPEMLASIGCTSTYDLSDLSFLTNSGDGERLAGARLVGRHPSLVAIDLSSFKCGQDAALYGRVAEAARGPEGKPFLALHDLDETRPVASLRLRVRTFLDGVERWEARAARRHPVGP